MLECPQYSFKKQFGQNIRRQWHKLDDSKKSIKSRADGRLTYDRNMSQGSTPPPPKQPRIKLSADKHSGNPPMTVEFTVESIGSPKSDSFIWKVPGKKSEESDSNKKTVDFNKEGTYKVTVQGKNKKTGKTSQPSAITIIVSDSSSSKGANIELYEGQEEEDVIHIAEGNDTLILRINKSSPKLTEFIEKISEIKVDSVD